MNEWANCREKHFTLSMVRMGHCQIFTCGFQDAGLGATGSLLLSSFLIFRNSSKEGTKQQLSQLKVGTMG